MRSAKVQSRPFHSHPLISFRRDSMCKGNQLRRFRVGHVYSDVEPLSGFGPAHIGQLRGRNDLVEGVVVDRIWLPLKFRVGSIYSFMDTKFVEVGPISGIQFCAAVVLWIGIVIRNSFAAQFTVGAQNPTRDFLRTATVPAVVFPEATQDRSQSLRSLNLS